MDLIEVEGFLFEDRFQVNIFFLDIVLELVAKSVFFQEIDKANADPRYLVFVSRPDAASGGADLALAAKSLASQIDGFVIRHALRQGTTTVRALPGALELLAALSAKDEFGQGVVTGNFEVTAQIKLEAAGLHSYLCRGAYASDSSHRPDLPKIAKARWEQWTGKSLRLEQCVIIGDTPKDLDAARQNDMKCILVGTGRYPVEELQYWGPDACLSDLIDTREVISILLNLKS